MTPSVVVKWASFCPCAGSRWSEIQAISLLFATMKYGSHTGVWPLEATASPPVAMELAKDQVTPWSVLAYMSILVLELSVGMESPAAMIVPAGNEPTACGSS